jgi:hypothetical protein
MINIDLMLSCSTGGSRDGGCGQRGGGGGILGDAARGVRTAEVAAGAALEGAACAAGIVGAVCVTVTSVLR